MMLAFALLFGLTAAQSAAKPSAILVNKEVSIVMTGPFAYTEKFVMEYEILDQRGAGHAAWGYVYKPGDKLVSFEAVMKDASGKVLRRVGLGGLQDYSYIDNNSLISDARVKYVDLEPAQFPVTCIFKGTREERDFFGITAFQTVAVNVPQKRLMVSVSAPDSTWLLVRRLNGAPEPARIFKNGKHTLEWKQEQVSFVEEPRYAPDESEWAPTIVVVPRRFRQGRFEGSWESWTSFGDFFDRLNKGRDLLPQDEAGRVALLTAGMNTVPQKLEAIYAYLKANTRYLNVNLGIGGNQTMTAAEVCRNKYGDCKGLSTYMKGMLHAAGIPSFYALVMRDDRRDSLHAGQPFYQFNHVILGVPDGADTLWVEATSQDYPAGYLDESTMDRLVLWVDGPASHLTRTPAYKPWSNRQARTATFVLSADGQLSGTVSEWYTGIQHEPLRQLAGLGDVRKMERWLLNRIPEGKNTVTGLTMTAEPEKPGARAQYRIRTSASVSRAGNRLFVRSGVLSTGFPLDGLEEERTVPLRITPAFADTDTLRIRIPAGTRIESLPEPVTLSGPGARYERRVMAEGDSVLIVNRLLEWNFKRLPASDRLEFQAFVKKAGQADRQSVVLIAK